MKKFRDPESREQISLLPRSLEEYVGSEDIARYVDALVESFDLSPIEEQYSEEGRPGYRPAILVKILVYGKIKGIRSSRELSRACKENVRFMYLAQNERPDFRTISLFRKKYIALLGDLLKQTVRVGIEEGVITLSHVAIDGTKIRANASHNSFKDRKKLEKVLDELDRSLRQDIALDEKEDRENGDDDGEPKLPAELQDRKVLAEKIRRALERSQGGAEKEEAKSVSMTDPEARFMKSRSGSHPSYNAQIGVDMKSLMVVGAYTTTAGSDHGELEPMLKEIKETAEKDPENAVTDRGYRALKGLVALEEKKIYGVVPLQGTDSKHFQIEQFIYNEEDDEYTCPAGRALPFANERATQEEYVYQSENCDGCLLASKCLSAPGARRSLRVSKHRELIQEMRQRVETPHAKKLLRWRSQTVELIFAWMKIHRKLTQFTFRGTAAVNHEWKFEAASLNILRLAMLRMKQATI